MQKFVTCYTSFCIYFVYINIKNVICNTHLHIYMCMCTYAYIYVYMYGRVRERAGVHDLDNFTFAIVDCI